MIKNRENFGIKIMIAGVALNMGLFLFKLYISVASGSICIYTDALNNLFDSIFCIIAIIGLRLAAKAATDEYPMGFGRAEYLANFVISAALLGAGCMFFYNALYQTIYAVPISFKSGYAYCLGATVIIKLLMALMYSKSGKKCDSELLVSMKRDSLYDAAVTSVTVISYALCNITRFNIDGIIGMAISLFIVINAFLMLKKSFKLNLGARNRALEEKIKTALLDDERIIGADNIIIHNYGAESLQASCRVTLATDDLEALKQAEKRVKEGLNINISFSTGE